MNFEPGLYKEQCVGWIDAEEGELNYRRFWYGTKGTMTNQALADDVDCYHEMLMRVIEDNPLRSWLLAQRLARTGLELLRRQRDNE